MKKKTNRLIIGGVVFIFLLALTVFLLMNRYMSRQTSRDVRNIAQTYLKGIAKEEIYHFTSIAEIRFKQVSYIEQEVMKLARSEENADSVATTISDVAELQDLRTCALIAGDGSIETVYGNPLTSLEDMDYVLEALSQDKSVATSGFNSNEHLIIWAVPATHPMRNDEMSVGILCCRRMSLFIEKLHLDADGTMAYFHVLKSDGGYLVQNEDTYGDNFYDRVLSYSVLEDGGGIQGIVSNIKKNIASGEDTVFSVIFTNPDTGISERRSIYITPMPNSDWSIAAVVPYGVLDETIADMGASRNRAMIMAVVVLSIGLFTVFAMYFALSQKQMRDLDHAREVAEDAMVEAETATEEAVAAKQSAEEALIEAETANEEAVKAREEADSANKAKSEFLSNMSHDIRTPMNAIVGMTAIAQSHIDNKSQVEDCLKKINLAGKQLLGLINDVLDMSKIESGKLSLNIEAVSLKETMETMCDIIRPQIHDRRQHFDIFINNIICENVYCDSVRLNQVLLNFLSNAMKYNKENGSVSISVEQEESPKGEDYVRTKLSVSDTGIGMSQEFIDKIFVAFEREDSKRVHKIQGTGLGMAITKYIVDAMEGRIDVTSKLGEGSTFLVTFDFQKAEVPEKDMKLPDWRILVVDDNKDLCESAVTTLEDLGTRPEYCTNGATAVRMVKNAKNEKDDYFAVLIDYKMDGMDGIETAKKIREMVGDDMPISIISAYDWLEIEDEARAAGVSSFIAKPLFKSTIYHEFYRYTEEGKKELADQPQAEEKKTELDGMKILLAEDQYVNAVIATTMLQESGAVVELAEDGQIALDKFKSSEPGTYKVILMDLRMPNMNGIEATKAIRSLDRADAADIPIIAMTADAFAEDVKKCLDAGMNGHIAKPINIDMLKKTLLKYNQ